MNPLRSPFCVRSGRMALGLTLWFASQSPLLIAAPQEKGVAQEKKGADTKGGVSNDELAAKLKPLIEKLDADSLADRDAAEQAIINLGPAIVPLLPKITAATSAEVEVRIRRLTEKLQTQSTNAIIESTSVNLKGTMSISEALKKVTEQTGNKFKYQSLPEKELTLDLEEVTFWDAVDEILDAGSLDVEPFGETVGTLNLRARQPTSGLRITNGVYVDSFRLEATELSATRSINDASQDSLRIKAWIAWEPRFKPVYMQFPMKDIELLLEDGTKLPAMTPDMSPEYSPTGNSSQLEVEFLVKLPPREATKIKGLRGKFNAALPGKQVRLTFDKLDKPGKKSEKTGSLTVSIDRVRKNGGIYEVITLIKLENGGQTMDSFRGWVMNNEAYLLDDKDKRVENVGWQTYKMGGNEVGISYLFDMTKGPENYRFIYDAPGAISEKEFKFKFPELPLP